MHELVSLKNVGKAYLGKTIFRNVNMSIDINKPTVIMGENGCGKSTLLKIIAGILSCTEGEVIHRQKNKISYMPDRFPKLPFNVENYLFHMGSIQGIPRKEVNNYINIKFNHLNMPQSFRKQKIYNCSKGTLQKINVLQALITKPDLLVLDEPFSGLDENSVDSLFELLNEIIENNTAVILSCHEKSLAQKITNDFFIFKEQQCYRSSDFSNCFCVKFADNKHDNKFDLIIDGTISINKTSELYEALIEKDQLKEILLFLFAKGYEIHSVNPIIDFD